MAETTSARIVTEVHDEPHIEGRRVTVRRIQGLVEGAERSPMEIAEELELGLADVYAALHYYHTHPEEMTDAEQRRQPRLDEAKQGDVKSIDDYDGQGQADDDSDTR